MARKIPWETRAAGYGLLARGVSAQRIGVRLGVATNTVKSWATLAGMQLSAGRHGGIPAAPMDKPVFGEADRSYRRLTLPDRSFIQAALALPEPMGVRAIARALGVAPSTVSREIRSKQITDWGTPQYSAELAHYQALTDRPRRPLKLDDPALRAEVVTRLNKRFSPQQIAGELRLMFPHRKEMRVSHETIYQALYVQGRGALREELKVVKALRSGRTGRLPQSKLPPRSNRPWLEGARLTDRPVEVDDRAVPGHWEGDLVVGPDNSGIVTLVERQTRFTLLGRLPGMRDSETVTGVLARMIDSLPAALIKTITWDQGSEMAEHAEFTVDTGCNVYFCDPHSPWQRGSNENTNGLIRDFYPKGTNFNHVTDEDLAETQTLLNIRPRQTLGFRNPSVMLNELITGVALQP